MSSLQRLVVENEASRRKIEDTEFQVKQWSWEYFVPEEVKAVWGELPYEAQLCVYLTARDAYINHPQVEQ